MVNHMVNNGQPRGQTWETMDIHMVKHDYMVKNL